MELESEHSRFLSVLLSEPVSPDHTLQLAETLQTSLGGLSYNNVKHSSSDLSSYKPFLEEERSSNASAQIRRAYRSLTTTRWSLELAGLVLSFFSLGAIIIVLAVHQKKTLPRWPWFITFNSVLSTLSQFSNMGLTTALVSAMSQQKWIWFGKSRKQLRDFARFDEASRGLWGSVLLVCSSTRLMWVKNVHLFFVLSTNIC